MQQRSEFLFLAEMAEATRKILDVCSANDVSRVNEWNHVLIDSLLWNFTVLGEAANKLSAEFMNQHSEVGWRHPISLRNRIVHGYWSVDLEILVETAEAELPGLLQQIERILGAEK